jgi:hypothetical protein
MRTYLKNDGYTVERVPVEGKKGKTILAGIPVKMDTWRKKCYDYGAVVYILCTGSDEKELKKDIETKRKVFKEFQITHKIPANRICDEIIMCQEKFEYSSM